MEEFACSGFSCGKHLVELGSFLCGEGHDVFLVHIVLLKLVLSLKDTTQLDNCPNGDGQPTMS